MDRLVMNFFINEGIRKYKNIFRSITIIYF